MESSLKWPRCVLTFTKDVEAAEVYTLWAAFHQMVFRVKFSYTRKFLLQTWQCFYLMKAVCKMKKAYRDKKIQPLGVQGVESYLLPVGFPVH